MAPVADADHQHGAAADSGVTLTIAHHALREDHRRKAIILAGRYACVLGLTFLCFQAYEYIHAYNELNLKLSSGVYGSTFFLLTGFHGFHVFLGGTCCRWCWCG